MIKTILLAFMLCANAYAGVTSPLVGKFLKIQGDTTGTVTITAPNSFSAYQLILPSDDGLAGDVLTTDGSGALVWTTAPASTSANLTLSNLDSTLAFNSHLRFSPSLSNPQVRSTSGDLYLVVDSGVVKVGSNINMQSNKIVSLANPSSAQDAATKNYVDTVAVTSVSASSPLLSSGGLTPNISIQVGNGSQNGYISSTDWNTFNNKVSASRAINTTSPLTGGGDLSANRTLSIPASTGSVDGYLSAVDWTTFNSKQAAGDYITELTGDVIAVGPGSVSASVDAIGGVTVSGSGSTISVAGSLNADDSLGVGDVAGSAIGTMAGKHIMVVSSDDNAASPLSHAIVQENIFSGATGGTFNGRHARGTPGSPAVLLSGDAISTITGHGHDGSQYRDAGTFSGSPDNDGAIQLRASQNFSPTAHGTLWRASVTTNSTTTRHTALEIQNDSRLAIFNSAGSKSVRLKANPTATTLDFILPIADGTSGQVLQTNGAGQLSFASAGGTPSKFIWSDTAWFGNPGLLLDSALTNDPFNLGFTDRTDPVVGAGTFNIFGQSITNASNSGPAGVVNVYGGTTNGTGNGGDVYVYAGKSTGGGTGGSVFINADSSPGAAAYTFVTAHEAGSGQGGSVLIQGGPGDSDKGGDVKIFSGGSYDGTNFGTGDIIIKQQGGSISDPHDSIFWNIGGGNPQKDTGNIKLVIEAGTSTTGKIQFQVAGDTSATGDVWAATDTDGSGAWTPPGDIASPQGTLCGWYDITNATLVSTCKGVDPNSSCPSGYTQKSVPSIAAVAKFCVAN